jgi:hypothetical protein
MSCVIVHTLGPNDVSASSASSSSMLVGYQLPKLCTVSRSAMSVARSLLILTGSEPLKPPSSTL